MEPNMNDAGEQKTGNSPEPAPGRGHLRLVLGGAPRAGSGPRRARAADPRFDREIAGIYATWRASGGRGRYASRAIANVAQRMQFSARVLDRHLEDAIVAGVPVDRVRDLGRAFIRRADVLAVRHRRLSPAA